MDLLTQGLLGAALAQTVARRGETRQATTIGFLSGLLADADVFIQSSTDPLFMLEFHRHFSHSLFFIPFGALLAGLILWPFFRKGMSFGRLYIFALLGFSLSGFIDTCTSYGTYLLWPLHNERISFHIISIVDPVFTLGLLLAVMIAFRQRTPRMTYIGLLYCGLYLSIGWWQQGRATTAMHELATSRGHKIERKIIKPTMGNLVLWRSIYVADQKIYVDGIRIGITGKVKIYIGSSVPLFVPEQDLTMISKDSVLYQDVLRFSSLVDGYIALYPGKPNLLGDARYSLLATSTEPLWAISLNRQQPDQHVQYAFYRNTDATLRQTFLDMLLER